MPRVNRDLQRRERDRRRPGEQRRYQFATPEPGLDEAALSEDGELTGVDQTAPRQQTVPAAAVASSRGGVRAAPKPFSAYKDEYAYVSSDLRRVAAVIGGLLLALIILYFLLPVLVH